MNNMFNLKVNRLNQLNKSNYWFSIWLRPKKVIYSIISSNPNYGLWTLSSICGLFLFFRLMQILSLKEWFFFIIGWMMSPFLGFGFISIIAWSFYKIGKMFRGKGDFYSVRAAVAWSQVPIIFHLISWGVFFAFCGKNSLFYIPNILSLYKVITISIFYIIQIIASIWSFCLCVCLLSYVQFFPKSKALINMIFSIFTLIGFFLVAVLFFSALKI